MNFEKRKKSAPKNISKNIATNTAKEHFTDLPKDYLALVETTLTEAVKGGLNEIKKLHPEARFHAQGALFSDEAFLVTTLVLGGQNISATTVYASADFDPTRESSQENTQENKSLEKVLSACVDAVGSVFDTFVVADDSEKLAQIIHHSLGAMEDAPFEWTLLPNNAIPTWVKVDKLNPVLETFTDKWLKENDPHYQKLEALAPEEVEAEEFLEERLEAIQKVKSGGGGNIGGSNSGPIMH